MAETFQREPYEQGITVFSTLLVKLGVWAEAQGENIEAALTTDYHGLPPVVTDYLDTLSQRDLMALYLILVTIQIFGWSEVIQEIAIRVHE